MEPDGDKAMNMRFKFPMFFTFLLLVAAPTFAQSKGSIENFDARALTAGEFDTFAPLTCSQGISQGQSERQFSCQVIVNYPTSYPGNEVGEYEITLTSVIYGHLTDGSANQAYVSYTANFESHADNFGGGILYELGAGGWQLVRWYPSLIMDGCVQLNATGQARMLCQGSYTGMGEVDTSLWLMTVPPAYNSSNDYSTYNIGVLKAQDDRQNTDQNYNCTKVTNPNQRLLLGIDQLARSDEPGVIAKARLSYILPSDLTSYCSKKGLADAPETEENIRFRWDGHHITMTPNYTYVPTDY